MYKHGMPTNFILYICRVGTAQFACNERKHNEKLQLFIRSPIAWHHHFCPSTGRQDPWLRSIGLRYSRLFSRYIWLTQNHTGAAPYTG